MLQLKKNCIRKKHLLNDYSIKADRIHTVQQLLKAYTLFEKDVEYVVMDGQVKIVDEQTGRILDGDDILMVCTRQLKQKKM